MAVSYPGLLPGVEEPVYKVLGTGLAHSVLVFFNSDDVNDGPVWQ